MTVAFIAPGPAMGSVQNRSLKDVQHGMGETGVFGEIFVVLGILIGLGGAVSLVMLGMGVFDDSPVGRDAAAADWIGLGFLLLIEGIGFLMFGILAMVSGWDRHHHPDEVH
jgi:hypothetical protein